MAAGLRPGRTWAGHREVEMEGEGGPGVRSLREGRPWGQRIGGKGREQEGVCFGLCGPDL